MSQANEPVITSTPVAEVAQTEVKTPAKRKKAPSRRKPVNKTARAASERTPGVYFQNTEGRVFMGDEFLIKQFKKRKFGLARITAAVYEEAMKNGGMTDPIDTDFDSDEEL